MTKIATVLMLCALPFASLLVGSPVYAAPFTWEFSGTADSGHWDDDSLAGLAYTLRVSTDTATPDGNGFNDFGQWFNLPASIEIETLGTRTLGNFAFIEQFRFAGDADRLWVRGPGGGFDSNIYLPLGILGDPDLLSVWGPVQTLGDGRSNLHVADPATPTPDFEIIDGDTANSPITVSTKVVVPEPATLSLIGVGLAVTALLSTRRRKAELTLRRQRRVSSRG